MKIKNKKETIQTDDLTNNAVIAFQQSITKYIQCNNRQSATIKINKISVALKNTFRLEKQNFVFLYFASWHPVTSKYHPPHLHQAVRCLSVALVYMPKG